MYIGMAFRFFHILNSFYCDTIMFVSLIYGEYKDYFHYTQIYFYVFQYVKKHISLFLMTNCH